MEIINKLEGYLKERFGSETRLMDMKPLGEGVHGRAFLIRFRAPQREEHLIMKALFPSRFGHDHYSDRAQVLLLANANYNEMPKHIKAVDVVAESPTELISVKDAKEYYIFMEEAKGEAYFKDLDGILNAGRLTDMDVERSRMLARLLAQIHSVKYTEEDAPILYRRRIRDLIGHGECIMGIADSFESNDVIADDQLVEYVEQCLPWWGRIRGRKERLCRVHGDFHPGNIRLEGSDLTLLDRSRGSWGDPADDVSCLGINYVYYAIRERGTFGGPFADLFRFFLETYLERTGDQSFFEVSQPFFAFRVLVLAHPRFYPDDTNETKRKLLNFGRSVLQAPRFQVDKISDYMEGQ